MNSIHPKHFIAKLPNYEVNRVCPSSLKAQSGLLGPLGDNESNLSI